ncbi:MAG: sugar phosphate isomerase/epimerase family protein [Gemmataceae bacterium]
MFNRRHFLASAGAALAAPAFVSSVPSARAARAAGAIDPIKRPDGPPKIQLGLAAYSFRKYLDLKKPTMTLFDFIDLAAELKVDGVELTQYYFAETTDEYVDRLKAACAKKNLGIFCLPIRNDFCQKDETKRKADIASVKEWTRRAARLGTKAVRIFAGNAAKGEEVAARQRCVDAIEECCKVAEEVGVTLCLENHGGVTSTADGLLAIVKAVKAKSFGVNIDSSNFRVTDVFSELARIVPYGVVSQIKTEIYLPGGKKQPMDFAKFFHVLKEGRFSGPVSLEHEANEDPKVTVPQHIKEIRRALNGA